MANRTSPLRMAGLTGVALLVGAGVFLVSPRPLHYGPPMPDVVAAESVSGSGQGASPDGDAEARTVLSTAASVSDPAPAATPSPPEQNASLPVLDLVRIGARGDVVVAGAGKPGADVVLLLDGQKVASARADASGNFVVLFEALPSGAPRILTLETRDVVGNVARALDSVIVAPASPPLPDGRPPAEGPPSANGPPQAQVVIEIAGSDATDARLAGSLAPNATEAVSTEADGDTTGSEGAEVDIAAAGAPATASDGADLPAAAEPAGRSVGPAIRPVGRVRTEGSPEIGAEIAASLPRRVSGAAEPDAVGAQARNAPAAPAPQLFRTGPEGISVLSEAVPQPDVREMLGIDAITYDALGEVALAGRGVRGTSVRIYLDNRPVALARVGRDGAWTAPLADVETGIYVLRLDEVSADGTVAARIETPFERTAPAIAAAARMSGATAITVQPGFTLWAISKGYFGEGIRYVQIFEANRSLIRDPDLIYPGQVFALPKVGE